MTVCCFVARDREVVSYAMQLIRLADLIQNKLTKLLPKTMPAFVLAIFIAPFFVFFRLQWAQRNALLCVFFGAVAFGCEFIFSHNFVCVCVSALSSYWWWAWCSCCFCHREYLLYMCVSQLCFFSFSFAIAHAFTGAYMRTRCTHVSVTVTTQYIHCDRKHWRMHVKEEKKHTERKVVRSIPNAFYQNNVHGIRVHVYYARLWSSLLF